MMTANFFVNVPIAPPKPQDFISAEETACASKNITLENLDNCQEWLGQFQKVEGRFFVFIGKYKPKAMADGRFGSISLSNPGEPDARPS
jgi:hypothetical protein